MAGPYELGAVFLLRSSIAYANAYRTTRARPPRGGVGHSLTYGRGGGVGYSPTHGRIGGTRSSL